jgi:hypothetical protein
MLTDLLERTRDWPAPLADLWRDQLDPDRSSLPAFGPEVRSHRPDESLALARQIDSLFPHPANREARLARVAVQAGLLLWNDQFDSAHAAAQSIEGEGTPRHGDYWHAILHRREPDYGNARYWLRRVGPHPLHATLDQFLAPRFDLLHRQLSLRQLASPQILVSSPDAPTPTEVTTWLQRVVTPRWNADELVRLCETCATRPADSPLVHLAELLQATEMTLLMDSSLQAAHTAQSA